jgi:hypothetical protein
MGTPNPHNVPGDFYVEDGCCLACGVPEVEAPGLFARDGDGQCYVTRQPQGGQELRRMLSVLRVQELQCIRYRGQDDDVVAHLIANRDGCLVDHLRPLPADIHRMIDAVPAPSAFAHRAAGAALKLAAQLQLLDRPLGPSVVDQLSLAAAAVSSEGAALTRIFVSIYRRSPFAVDDWRVSLSANPDLASFAVEHAFSELLHHGRDYTRELLSLLEDPKARAAAAAAAWSVERAAPWGSEWLRDRVGIEPAGT